METRISANLMEAYREELRGRITQAMSHDGTHEPLPGLHLYRRSATTDPTPGVSFPSLCIIAQGRKEVYLGQECYRYDPYQYLLATIELPVVIQHIEASPERPYLSLRMELDPAQVASVLLEAGISLGKRETDRTRAIAVSPLNDALLEAVVRLLRLVGAPPAETELLLPLLSREITVRLLLGDQGARLHHLAAQGGNVDRISQAIETIRRCFDKPLRVESLARELGMSPSGFYSHFKSVTAMSHLQFQKQLRLQEARRLLWGEDVDAATAGYRVGYEDASQFSKEYKRLFGAPPRQDMRRQRILPTDG